MLDTFIVGLLALLTNSGFYALLITSIVCRTTIFVVREANLGKKYKRRVVDNLRQIKHISDDLSARKADILANEARIRANEKVIQKHKLDKQFKGLV